MLALPRRSSPPRAPS